MVQHKRSLAQVSERVRADMLPGMFHAEWETMSWRNHGAIDLSNPIRVLGTIPHCDPRILHAPGECEFCDTHPDWQALRQVWGIAFTGYEPGETELPCPAMYARPEMFERWGGNLPCK